MDPVSFLFDLVRVPSPSGDEGPAAEVLAEALLRLGWERSWIDPVGNVLASRGDGLSRVALFGHLDTVPGGPEPIIRGGQVWGRGSVDAKGPLCAMAVAGSRVELPPRVGLVLVAAVGEEVDSRGARHALASGQLEGVRAVVVGEPTGTDGVALSYRGRVLLRLSDSDGGAHRSCDSGPLTRVLMGASRVISHVSHLEGFSSAVVHMEGEESGGRSARVTLDLRVPVGASALALVEELVPMASGVRVELLEVVEPHSVGAGDPVVSCLRGSIRGVGHNPRMLAKLGTCDFNVLAPLGVPMGVYGPGDPRLDHSDQERLDVGDYLRSIEVLSDAIPRIVSRVCNPQGR